MVSCRLELEDRVHKLEAVLQEIKEIAENNCKACKEFTPEKCKPTNCRYCFYKQIPQKISDCEV